jgi:hypothetical protein
MDESFSDRKNYKMFIQKNNQHKKVEGTWFLKFIYYSFFW